jgi:hypothetical protein
MLQMIFIPTVSFPFLPFQILIYQMTLHVMKLTFFCRVMGYRSVENMTTRLSGNNREGMVHNMPDILSSKNSMREALVLASAWSSAQSQLLGFVCAAPREYIHISLHYRISNSNPTPGVALKEGDNAKLIQCESN